MVKRLRQRKVMALLKYNLTVALAAIALTSLGCQDHTTHNGLHGHSHQTSGGQPAAALAPAAGAKVRSLTPTSDQIFSGDEIPLHFELVKGKRGEHVHAYVDGEIAGMFKTTKRTLTGIKPGNHILEIRVVTADHNTELDGGAVVHSPEPPIGTRLRLNALTSARESEGAREEGRKSTQHANRFSSARRPAR
jgi:hypothetical protein